MSIWLFRVIEDNGRVGVYSLIYSSQVYAQKETCSEELNVERLVSKGLQQVVLQSSSESRSNTNNPKLQLIWGTTVYHIDDLPFDTSSLPDVYTQFRKAWWLIILFH